MCGFLAEYTIQNNLITKNEFISLLHLSQKRGPDYQGYWSNNQNVQLGFNRLAIVDLSEAGQQPMRSYNNRYTIVFNGEIYNHQELRRQLVFSDFKGQSDTETIAACLEEWGIEKTIQELDGMFAIVIFDSLTDALHLIRDFAGIKPLFYGFLNGKLVAASQYDQIKKHPNFVNQPLDEQVLKLYLQQHFIPAPFGLYKGTFQVRPGEIITFTSKGEKKQKMYWEFPVTKEYEINTEKEAKKIISDTLESCIKDQLVADVSLGAFLSGGVDSPLVCSYAKKFHKDLEVFSIGSDSKVHDESDRAKSFANALELKQHLWRLDAKETMKYWEEAMLSLHEPLADFSILPTYLVSKLAKQNVTVALSGDGGDELFFGYERFWSLGKNAKYQNLPLLLRKGIYGFDKYASGNKNVNSLLLLDSQAKAQEGLHSRFKPNWLTAIAPDLDNTILPNEWNVYDYENETNEIDLVAKIRKAEFYGMMQKTLRKVDLASMENSLEVRVPFLQKKMIEASLKINPSLNYGNGKQKKLLKKLLHERVPNIQEEKAKKGFSIPLSKWIKEDLKGEFSDSLLNSKQLDSFGFDTKQIEKMLTTHIDGKQDLKWPLFTLYTLTK